MQCSRRPGLRFLPSRNGFVKEWKGNAGSEAGIHGTELTGRNWRMRGLVTGHKGYIGTMLVPMLQEAGQEVLGLDSDLYRNSTYGEALPDVAEIVKDIRDVEKTDLAGIDAIIHLAGLSNDT